MKIRTIQVSRYLFGKKEPWVAASDLWHLAERAPEITVKELIEQMTGIKT